MPSIPALSRRLARAGPRMLCGARVPFPIKPLGKIAQVGGNSVSPALHTRPSSNRAVIGSSHRSLLTCISSHVSLTQHLLGCHPHRSMIDQKKGSQSAEEGSAAASWIPLSVFPTSSLGDDFPYVLSAYPSVEYVVDAITCRKSVFRAVGCQLEGRGNNFSVRRLDACRRYRYLLRFFCLLCLLYVFRLFPLLCHRLALLH